MRTFIDRGGTFTDVVIIDDDTGAVDVRKVPSDQAIMGDLARGRLTFGTTVATNALLERTRARTALVVTRGFADLPWIGDQSRPALFDPDATRAAPLVDRVIEVDGRIDADGVERDALALPDTWDLEGIEAVAVVLVNSHVNAAHERAVAAALGDQAGFVTCGHAVSPELGYLARLETTLVDAAITPILARALQRDRIPADALAMKSDGGLCPAATLRAPDAVLSGPAGGVLAVRAVARQAGFERAVGLDMGGTSTDVCRVDGERLPRREEDVTIAGVRVRRPVLEVETIAAGGGSVLSDDGLRLRVGPASAGANPGPACYGRGGPLTLTDAALAAGLIDPGRFPIPLDTAAVKLNSAKAHAYLRVAREAMAHAIRRLATARGVDVRDHALVAYGGAAGQHAARVAELLSIRTVLVHPCAAVLCAWGQALARRRETATAAVWKALPSGLTTAKARLRELDARLPVLAERLSEVTLRHVGTDHAIALPLSDDADANTLRDRFDAEHRARYGFVRPEARVEVVDVRLHALGAQPAPPRVDADPWGVGSRAVDGPALLTSDTTAVAVPAGWTARLADGLLRLDRTAAIAPGDDATTMARTPLGVELWGNRFQAVAEEAGTVLRRLARSVNIRERLDFSCAVFDAAGQLVANAPHIPVHLGAMGETVRDLMRRHPDVGPGQHWLCNDPAAGGSHLPDLTVVTAVSHEGARWFVANRGHHVDVGGTTPGSMPPDSRTLADEGAVLRHVPLLTSDGALADLAGLIPDSRQPQTVAADLRAQIAANVHAARALATLGPAPVVDRWMAHLRDVAREAVREVLDHIRLGHASDDLSGVPLALSLERAADGRLIVDFTGTGGPHDGNLNAPAAVVRAAVLYSLRVLVGRPIPLNEGCLADIELRVPTPSVLAPPAGAAVVGGNVETSQRLVDLFMRAAGARADSAGTMNNLTLGGADWSFYATLGGGLGASHAGGGVSARQLHMTNTRATDVEVLEKRLPVRVLRFAVRAGSGGRGRHTGGDGLIRELELLAPATAALLAAWRPQGAAGLAGGGRGAPGGAAIAHAGGDWTDWDGRATLLAAGARLRVLTPGGGGWGRADTSEDR